MKMKLNVCFSSGLWASCGLLVAEPTMQQAEFFEKQVRPVLAEHCFECHGAQKQRGGLRMDSREAILKGGDEGPAVVPGNPDQSLLIQAVRHAGDLKMPKGKEKLGEREIAALVEWVRIGAPWPSDGAKAKSQTLNPNRHWAFQPVARPRIPAVRNKRWVRNEIDAFVLAKLEAKRMSPSKPADRRTLIRRVYFDLTGLPPTFEEIEAFVADRSPDALEKVVDRLLASPRFGERWGRYWLDLARYSDTKGYVFEEERRYPYSYTYRDWVIKAFNDDLPYDRFLLYQIAADKLVSPQDPSPLAAMGFLTLGRRFLNNQPDIIDDRIDVLTRSTMALTVSCARCHDHKYDPIPTQDYYSLYGIFASSVEPKDLPLLGEPERTEKYLAFERELQKREGEATAFLESRRKAILADLRKPESIAAYLLAWRDARGKNEEEVRALVKERDLNRTMFGRWKKYLDENGASHAIFGAWHDFAAIPDAEFVERAASVAERVAANSDPKRPLNSLVSAIFMGHPPASLVEVAVRYGKLLGPLTRAERRQFFDIIDEKGNVVTVFREHDERANLEEEALMQALTAIGAPLDVPPNETEKLFNRDDNNKLRALRKRVEEWKATSPAAPPRAMVLNDLPQPVSQRVFKRGNPSNLGEPAPRRFLEVLSKERRPEFQHGSGRLELAQAIASAENPLTARVAANRVWLHLFGAGIVRTPSDFGMRSDPPSHPELLDWLAARLVADGWSQKKLIRLIMLSSTYQQASDDHPKYRVTDPDNMLLWKQNRRRLDFEAMRDSLLAVSGKLDLTMGGPGVDLEKQPFTGRRSVYGYIERQNLPALFRTFDFANPDAHAPQRHTTTIPQQALFMMNSPFVIEQARALAAKAEKGEEVRGIPDTDTPKANLQNRIAHTELRITRLYRLAYGRAPTREELHWVLEFLGASEVPMPNPEYRTPWQYGYGHYDQTAQQVKFTPLPYWTGEAWQGGAQLPDSKLGWVMLTAAGGHPGNNLQHAAVRRWIAPRAAVLAISGALEQPSPEGDGVRGFIVLTRAGQASELLLQKTVRPAQQTEMKMERVEVKAGDALDFIVDINDSLGFDSFLWVPVIHDRRAPYGQAAEWNAQTDFRGPAGPAVLPLSAWEKLAQVLLLANEFAFTD